MERLKVDPELYRQIEQREIEAVYILQTEEENEARTLTRQHPIALTFEWRQLIYTDTVLGAILGGALVPTKYKVQTDKLLIEEYTFYS